MSKFLIAVITLIIGILLFHPGRHAKYYNYIPIFDTINELTAVEPQSDDINLKICSREFYAGIITSGLEIDREDIFLAKNFALPLNGGEYAPKNCRAIFKTAVIVPYRSWKQYLETFVNYMHAFLQEQRIHYRIFVVEQNDELPFNRAKMLNVGANEAIKSGFPCLVLHDVDLFPLNAGNIYACCQKPRHMSSSIDTFRFNLPYEGLFGGVIAIQAKHFQRINGMSNVFDGWGGEDDDFFKRLETHNLTPCRFAPEMSRYTMLFHKKANPSKERWHKLQRTLQRQTKDGLNSLPNNYKVVLESLYTHVIV